MSRTLRAVQGMVPIAYPSLAILRSVGRGLNRAVCPSGDAAEIFDRAIRLPVDELERRRFAETASCANRGRREARTHSRTSST